jgi:hypothetical protein
MQRPNCPRCTVGALCSERVAEESSSALESRALTISPILYNTPRLLPGGNHHKRGTSMLSKRVALAGYLTVQAMIVVLWLLH